LSNELEKKEIGVTYKIDEILFVTRAKDLTNIEKSSTNKIESVLELLMVLGEI
jgi:hypothetical protein